MLSQKKGKGQEECGMQSVTKLWVKIMEEIRPFHVQETLPPAILVVMRIGVLVFAHAPALTTPKSVALPDCASRGNWHGTKEHVQTQISNLRLKVSSREWKMWDEALSSFPCLRSTCYSSRRSCDSHSCHLLPFPI